MSQITGKLPLFTKKEEVIQNILSEYHSQLNKEIIDLRETVEQKRRIWFKTSSTFLQIGILEKILEFKEKSLEEYKKLEKKLKENKIK